MKHKLIWCNTKEKLAKVIEKLKKDGYTSDSVDRMWESYGNKVTVMVRKEFKDITFASKSWYEGNNYGTPITADEFLGKSKNPSVRVDWSNDSGTYYYECNGDSRFTTFHYSEEMLDKWDESKIHEGDTVKVVNTGLNYSSYAQWVGEHISDPYMAARFCFGSPSLDEKYKVIKIAEHERNHRPLAYIEQIDGIGFNKCYLIEVKGLEKV